MKWRNIFSLLLVLTLARGTLLHAQTCVVTGAGECFALGGSGSGGAILNYHVSCNDVAGAGTTYLRDGVTIACSAGISGAAIQPVTSSGTLRNFYCLSGSDAPSGESFVFTVLKEGTETAVTCTMASGASECQDTAHTAAVTAGDQLAVSMTESGAGTDSGIIQCSWEVAL